MDYIVSMYIISHDSTQASAGSSPVESARARSQQKASPFMFARRMYPSGCRSRRGWLAAAGFGLLVSSGPVSASAATAAGAPHAAAEPFVPTPAQLFGALFVQVQMDALYPDGKTFADAVPKAPPPAILRRYRSAGRDRERRSCASSTVISPARRRRIRHRRIRTRVWKVISQDFGRC